MCDPARPSGFLVHLPQRLNGPRLARALGATVVRKRPLVWWAALFGALPDLLGSAPGFFHLLFAQGILWGTDTWQFMPQWTRDAYHLSHSLLGLGIMSVALAAVSKQWLILALPYAIHLALDLVTHVTDPLARLFFPFVPWGSARVIGVNWWESWWTVGTNAFVLIAVNLLLWHRRRSHREGALASES